MKTFWPIVFLGLGAACFTVFWIIDLAGVTMGRHLIKGMIEGFFLGHCLEENLSYGFNVHERSFPYPFHSIDLNFTISKRLSGLRLGVRVNPFRLEDKDGKLTYIEEGVWALQVEVENKTMWIMQDPEHSTMTVRQPFYNVNLLTVLLAPMVVDAMPEGSFPVDVPVPPVSFENKSIIDRVKTAWNVTDAIKKVFNYTEEANSLREIHGFLSLGGDAALAYRNSRIELGKRHLSLKPKFVWSMRPPLPKPAQLHLPGLENLTFDYWESSDSGVAGLSVDMYRAKEIWEPNILCQLTSRSLLNMAETLLNYGVFLTAPGRILSRKYNILSSAMPYAVILAVYRPFAVPIGTTVAVQVGYLIPYNESFGKLQGELTPVMRVEVKIEELPDKATCWLVSAINIHAVLLILFLILFCFFFLLGVTLLAVAMRDRGQQISDRRQQISDKTRTLEQTPL